MVVDEDDLHATSEGNVLSQSVSRSLPDVVWQDPYIGFGFFLPFYSWLVPLSVQCWEQQFGLPN